ncbi:MAG: hypothetical protein R3C44_09000 [Chloroflexota bacterium]
MSEQDNIQSDSEDVPRDMTSDELDEALRWLEEIAGKQGKSLDGLVSLDEAALEDSPFKGLFDSDEQELPDWLREVPGLSDPGDENAEGESRLDWLARMASRESVEELPTLEWRRLTEMEDDDLVDAMPETAAAIAGLPATEEPEEVTPPPEEPEEAPPAIVALMTEMAEEEAVAVEAEVEETDLAAPTPPIESEIFEEVEVEVVTPEISLVEELPAQPEEIEAAVFEVEPATNTTPEDLDAAMAWLEELAASQDAPIEDLPSVADRALASKLIAEAASNMPPGEGLDISQLGIAMSGIYVGETKLASTGPLVGEGPADETPDSALHAEVNLATETDGDEVIDEVIEDVEVVAELETGYSVVEEVVFEEIIVEETVLEDPH